MRRLSFFDAFAGIGGFRMALEGLGWGCTGYCEIDEGKREAYRSNFSTAGEAECGDIAGVSSLHDADVLTGGFPCPSFSTAGRRKGFADSRGALFFQLVRLLETSRPKAFLFENVVGLAQMHQEMLMVVRSIVRAGYGVKWAVLESSMFGAPQRRRRLFFAGFRGGLPPEFAFPRGSWDGSVVRDVMEDDVGEEYFARPEVLKSTGLLVPPSWKERRPRILVLGNRSLTGFGLQAVLSPYGLAPTLVRMGGGSPATCQPYYLSDDARTFRRLTPKEWGRLQAFPDSFALPGDDRLAYRYLGDSVTTTVVAAVGREMQRSLE